MRRTRLKPFPVRENKLTPAASAIVVTTVPKKDQKLNRQTCNLIVVYAMKSSKRTSCRYPGQVNSNRGGCRRRTISVRGVAVKSDFGKGAAGKVLQKDVSLSFVIPSRKYQTLAVGCTRKPSVLCSGSCSFSRRAIAPKPSKFGGDAGHAARVRENAIQRNGKRSAARTGYRDAINDADCVTRKLQLPVVKTASNQGTVFDEQDVSRHITSVDPEVLDPHSIRVRELESVSVVSIRPPPVAPLNVQNAK